jgi:hypothetical protein
MTKLKISLAKNQKCERDKYSNRKEMQETANKIFPKQLLYKNTTKTWRKSSLLSETSLPKEEPKS